jgi:hypothetical protein
MLINITCYHISSYVVQVASLLQTDGEVLQVKRSMQKLKEEFLQIRAAYELIVRRSIEEEQKIAGLVESRNQCYR